MDNETTLDLDHERLERVRTAVIDQSVGLGLQGLAQVVDGVSSRATLLELAVDELCDALNANEDEVRLSLTVGMMLAPLARELKP